LVCAQGFAIVPQQSAYVIERFGKFHQILEPGLHFLIPFVDRIAYSHSLKEEAISVSSQQAITRDNVSISTWKPRTTLLLDNYRFY
jgi:regulator of protease activity HflC (stomatin/prohibitin superfamily)